nr:MAG TPA: hypothetical protein [Caudoviricetes sp.]DAW68972.1 MAG TPA: hypothetical protein [Caudoviricetes sp.]
MVVSTSAAARMNSRKKTGSNTSISLDEELPWPKK